MEMILKDLAYLTGITISTFDEYKVQSHDKKRFKADMVNAVAHYFWSKDQKGKAMTKNLNKQEKGILKNKDEKPLTPVDPFQR